MSVSDLLTYLKKYSKESQKKGGKEKVLNEQEEKVDTEEKKSKKKEEIEEVEEKKIENVEEKIEEVKVEVEEKVEEKVEKKSGDLSQVDFKELLREGSSVDVDPIYLSVKKKGKDVGVVSRIVFSKEYEEKEPNMNEIYKISLY